MQTRLTMAALAFLTALGGVGSAATIKPLALGNGPSAEPGYVHRRFEKPAISDAVGQRVAVFARTKGRRCIFTFDPDTADPDTAAGSAVVACWGDLTPLPPPQFVFRRFGVKFGDVSINLSSRVGWASEVFDAGRGVFQSNPLEWVARTGDAAPGTAGVLDQMSFGRNDDTGGVAFVTTVSGDPVVTQGVFRCSGGNGKCSPQQPPATGVLTAIALVGDAVPDRAGRKFCEFIDMDSSIYGTAFRAATKVDCADAGETPLDGVFLKPLGVLPIRTLALIGEPAAPNLLPVSTYWRLYGRPSIANTGIVAFGGTTQGEFRKRTLFLCDPTVCPTSPAIAAVQEGQGVITGPVAASFHVFSAPGVSDVGDIAFTASLIRPGRGYGAFIRRTNGTFTNVGVSGDPVPNLSQPASWVQFLLPSMSPGGKMTFVARIRAQKKVYGVFAYE